MPPPCREFNKGTCKAGTNCKYLHVKVDPNQPCEYFLKGSCRDGDNCLYSHQNPNPPANTNPPPPPYSPYNPVVSDSSRLCKYYQAGFCGLGSRCEFDHTDTEESRYNAEHFFAGPECKECPFDSKPGGCYRINAEHHRTMFHPSLHRLAPRRELKKGETRYDWKMFAEVMPTERSEKGKERRKVLFKQIDFNSNGYLSLAELDKWVVESLGMKDVIPKKVLLRAFMASNSVAPSRKENDHDWVTFAELRVLFINLRRYLQIYEVFDDIDSCLGERDGRITMREYQHSVKMLKQQYGVPDHALAQMEKSLLTKPMKTMACQAGTTPEGHMVLFQEFSNWGLKLDLNRVASDGFTDADLHGKPTLTHGEM